MDRPPAARQFQRPPVQPTAVVEGISGLHQQVGIATADLRQVVLDLVDLRQRVGQRTQRQGRPVPPCPWPDEAVGVGWAAEGLALASFRIPDTTMDSLLVEWVWDWLIGRDEWVDQPTRRAALEITRSRALGKSVRVSAAWWDPAVLAEILEEGGRRPRRA